MCDNCVTYLTIFCCDKEGVWTDDAGTNACRSSQHGLLPPNSRPQSLVQAVTSTTAPTHIAELALKIKKNISSKSGMGGGNEHCTIIRHIFVPLRDKKIPSVTYNFWDISAKKYFISQNTWRWDNTGCTVPAHAWWEVYRVYRRLHHAGRSPRNTIQNIN
jgi:hypothetical protein